MNGNNNHQPLLIPDSSGQIWQILPENKSKPNYTFKILIIGNSGVGKSCLTVRGTTNKFHEDSIIETIGFEYSTLQLKRQEDKIIIELQIWDTCGQERYRSLITNFYRNSSLAIMVYSIENSQSFEDLDIWLKELKIHSNPDAKVFVIGNKVDLEDKREVERNRGVKFTQNFKLDYFFETSAKTGCNAHNIFVEAAKLLYEDYVTYTNQFGEIETISKLKGDLPSVASKTTARTYDTGCAC